MKVEAVVFDIGHTLVSYNNPLNWTVLYKPALQQISEKCNMNLSDKNIEMGSAILTKYNTRENPREKEVSSDCIFKDIFDAWGLTYSKIDYNSLRIWD